MNRKFIKVIIPILLLIISACSTSENEESKSKFDGNNELYLMCDASLEIPVKSIVSDYEKLNPGLKINTEFSGTCDLARKISDLGKPCDVFISSDYQMTEKLLYTQFLEWQIKFATEEMVIAYNQKSEYSSVFSAENWTKILLQADVKFGRVNPDADPCGYRSVFLIKLAQTFYNLSPEFYDSMLFKDLENLRLSSADLTNELKKNKVDYIFTYKSIAMQNKFKFIEIPSEINLGNAIFDSIYNKVEIKLGGKVPGEFIKHNGQTIQYAVSISKNSLNRKMADNFLNYFFDKSKGLKVFENNHIKLCIPAGINNYDKIPSAFRKYALKNG